MTHTWTNDFSSLFSQLLNDFVSLLPSLCVAVLLLVLFWVAGKIVSTLIRRMSKHRSHQQLALYALIARTASIAITLLGLMCALGTLGINITALVTSLGLVGFAVGFALKDALSNICAGFMLLLYEPIELDSTLTLASVTGKVIDINLRYTTIDTGKAHVMIPNSTVLSSTIHVATTS